MAFGKPPFSKRPSPPRSLSRKADQKRRSLLESLEARHMMTSPQLIGIQPNAGDLLEPGVTNVRQVSPRELVFRFDDNQVIDPTTLAAIQVTRSGGDGTFSQPTVKTDFGSAVRLPANDPNAVPVGGAEVLLTGVNSELAINVTINKNLPNGAAPQFNVVVGSIRSPSQAAVPTTVTISVGPNTSVGTLVNAINSSSSLTSVMRAEVRGGLAGSLVMADPAQTTLPVIAIQSNNDIVVVPGARQISEAPRQNEVTLRFIDELPDDLYRIEVFGFDDPARSIVGLRNQGVQGAAGELLQPRVEGTRKDDYFLELNLGPRVESVIPQPVVRGTSGRLEQRRNEIVVYFNDDNLFIENDPSNVNTPTPRSAENPAFYSLILTNETASNLDDQIVTPSRVVYNPLADTATLIFADDLANLFGGKASTDTLRLRIGTNETLPIAPVPVNLGGRAASVNLQVNAPLTLQSRQPSQNITVSFAPGATSSVTVLGTAVNVVVGSGSTAISIANLLNSNPTASALVSATANPDITGVINASLLPATVSLPSVPGSAGVVPIVPGTTLHVQSLRPGQDVSISFQAGIAPAATVTGNSLVVTVVGGETVADIVNLLNTTPSVAALVGVTVTGPTDAILNALALPPTLILPRVSSSVSTATFSVADSMSIESRVEGQDVQVNFVSGATAGVTVSGRTINITVALGQSVGSLTGLIAANPAASALIAMTINGSPGAIINALPAPASLTLKEVGGTYETAYFLGDFIGTGIISQKISSAIDPKEYAFELIGGNDDPGHRPLPETIGGGREQHVNIAFGSDVVNGVTTIPYNFKTNYVPGRTNTISDRQKDRIREALDLWSDVLGVQFVETPDRGLTFARGDLTAFNTAGTVPSDVYVRNDLNFSVRVDPRLATPGFDTGSTSGVLVLNSLRSWQDRYGEDFFRTSMAGIGFLLGLEGATDLPANTLMALSDEFLSPAFQRVTTPLPTGPTPSYITRIGPERLEPVFPGNADIIHGQYLYRPESNDVDLYRFEVSLNDPNRVGELSVETFAERLATSSLLDTTVTLYRQVQASVETDFQLNRQVKLRLDALAPGLKGNRTSLQVVVTQSGSAAPTVSIDSERPNAILVFTRDPASVSFQALANAINAHPEASKLVKASLVHGDEINPNSIFLGNLAEATLPQILSGGRTEEIAWNDDYYSEDSFLKAEIGDGTYYIAVAARGNKVEPLVQDGSFGGKSQGAYELLVKYRPQVDETNVLRDLDGNVFSTPSAIRMPGSRFDGDSNGLVGGNHDFWFQTRPLERRLVINAGDRFADGQTMTITDASGISRTFEFSTDGVVPANRRIVQFSPSDPASKIATALRDAISLSGFLVTATATGSLVTLSGEREVTLGNGLTGVELIGKTIFVDKAPSAGPQADGTLNRPFNNIASPATANAFAAARQHDIVRIVGNGGADGNIATVGDNLAYQIGFSTLNDLTLEDGTEMEIPFGVTVMVDAGAIFKMRRSYIGVGSTSLNEDRSESVLQILGTPRLIDNQGRVVTSGTNAVVPGSVFFTSWLDESIGLDTFNPTTVPEPGNWGGIMFARDIDRAEGRPDLENEGVFVQHVGFADIRYGGGKNIVIDNRQQVVSPVQIVDRRPTIVHNAITQSGDAAISATPDSFEETNFQSSRFQVAGQFTSDYDRVGPDIYRNRLVNNSINGLFIRSITPAGGTLRELTVNGRFDDTDVVHYIAENLVVSGTPGNAIVNRAKAPVALVTGRTVSGGTLPAGTYRYHVTMVDAFGNESLPSDPTLAITISGTPKGIELASLPPASDPFVARRLYRSRLDGAGFDLVVELDGSDTRIIDRGARLNAQPLALNLTATEVLLHRPDASLVMDPGLVVKLEGARIEVEIGAQLLAEGLPGLPIVLTSKLDDRFGVGGTLDTNNDDGDLAPNPGDWGGIYVAPKAHLSLDYATVAYAGGLTRIEGTFKNFSAIELQQGTARITNSVFQDNADGQGGQGPLERFGRLANSPSTIFARGTQPILVGNTFLRGQGSPLDIDVGAFTSEILTDIGRQTGPINSIQGFDHNYGPLVRLNRFEGNTLNGMEIRGAELTTESVWDDTDIVHVLYDEVSTGNFHSSGGLRLQSSENESLVVKFAGFLRRPDGREVGSGSPFQDRFGTGLTAFGALSDAPDRIGGTLHIVGRPGHPVVLTSLADDSVGAGLRPNGQPQTDTNNDGFASRPRANDWRGVLLDEYSNDRNVAIVLERESPVAVAPGVNGNVKTAQLIGELAGDVTESDETRRLGFTLQGVLSEPTDVDHYAFIGEAGREVWIDIDYTAFALDSVVEILDSNGNVLARSRNSTAEAAGASLDVPGLDPEQVGPLQRTADVLTNFTPAGIYDEFGTLNPRDAGMRVTLPGVRGTRSDYVVRVRSAGVDINDTAGGLTAGSYTLQLRLQEAQEIAGSTVEFADIRYAHTGVHLRGQPYHSPLTGEAQENEDLLNTSVVFRNDSLSTSLQQPGIRAQYLGNLLASDRAAISVGGSIGLAGDVDFYQFDVQYVGGAGTIVFPTIFDLDYADEFGRPDLNMAVFYDPDGEVGPALPQLVLFGSDSNIADDRSGPLFDDLTADFLRGSIGAGDPFIGTQALPEGTYYVAISEKSQIPSQLLNPAVRREPITSVQRIVDDKIESFGDSTALSPKVPQFFSRDVLPAGWEITTDRANDFGHGTLSSFDGSRVGTSTSVFNGAVVIEQESTIGSNDQRGSATNLDVIAPLWSLGFDPNIGDLFANTSTFLPHTSIYGTLSGFDIADVYQVSHTGGRFIADIDFAASGFTGGIDTSLVVLSAGGAVVATGSANPSLTSSTLSGAGGSASFADPFFIDDALPAGTYFIGVMPPGTTYNTQNGLFTQATTFAGFVPGTYVLQVSSEGRPVTTTTSFNESLHFRAGTGVATPSIIESAAFSLQGYSAEDLPTLYFTYLLDGNTADQVFVRVVSASNPTGTVIASNTGLNPLMGDFNDWRQLRIDLGQFAGQSGLRLQIEYNDNGIFGGQEGLFLDDFIIGFAERGELVTGALPGADSYIFNGTAGSVTTGSYQVEIRGGTDYTLPNSTGGITLVNSFDTNERQEQSVTFIAPEGDQLKDRDFFQLGDGGRSIEFEFDNDGSVSIGRIRIPFETSHTASQIAASIIQAINSTQVQSVLSLKAATPSGSDVGDPINGGPRINIFGNPTGDFQSRIEQRLSVNVNTAADQLAQLLAGPDVTVSNATLISGPNSAGTFMGGQSILGVDRGVILANGTIQTALGPNISDSTSSTASGVSDPTVDATFGAATTDSTALEFDVTLPTGATSLFLQLTFASEEYAEDVTVSPQDIASVFVNGIVVPVGIIAPSGNANAEISTNVYPSTSPETTVNDPTTGGNLLDSFGYDGFSFVLRAAATGLTLGSTTLSDSPLAVNASTINVTSTANFPNSGILQIGSEQITYTGKTPNSFTGVTRGSRGTVAAVHQVNATVQALTHRVKIVIADNGPNTIDSALFLSAGSLSTVAPGNIRSAADSGGRVVFPAIIGGGFGDQNLKREQGQIIIQNNKFTEITAYGVWAEPGSRQADPEDDRINPLVENPLLGSTSVGAVRNLRALNEEVIGGMVPGAVIQNNVFDNAGVAAVHIAGEIRPWMISPIPVSPTENQDTLTVPRNHFGDSIGDGATMTVVAGSTTVVFEFEDLQTGGGGGNGVTPGRVPIYYRTDGGPLYNPSGPTPNRLYGYNEFETVHAMRDAILGSILVTNGLVQLVDPIVGPSLRFPSEDGIYGLGLGMTFSHPALYIHGASRVSFGGTAPFINEQAPVFDAPQPFARVVNNTIYGTDGNLASTQTATGTQEPNDVIAQAIDTRQGRGHNPAAYTTNGVIGSNVLSDAQDVDYYSFSLDVGDRVFIDIDTDGAINSTLDASLRLFNSRGEPVLLNNPLGAPSTVQESGLAPGETVAGVVGGTGAGISATQDFLDLAPGVVVPRSGFIRIGAEIIFYSGNSGTQLTGLRRGQNGTTAVAHPPGTPITLLAGPDPFIDFRATEKGVYYVAVSASGNTRYDPFSLADRDNGTTTGAYGLSINVLAPRTFVLTPDVNVGGTITITQVANIAGQQTNSVTINLDNLPGDRPWDKAAALADLINATALTQLRNDEGSGGPITRVEAAALGGPDGDVPDIGVTGTVNGFNGGVPDNYTSIIAFPRTPPAAGTYNDNLFFARPHHATPGTDFNDLGFGHDRVTGNGLGTSELFVWVRNAVSIDISNATGLRRDPAPTANGDQLLPQLGILVSGGASPTLMNNVIINTHGAIVDEGLYNGSVKPGQVVVGGSVFQGTDNRNDLFRTFSGSPFPTGPSNVNASQDDFNLTSPDNLRIVQNAEGGNFLPSHGSFIIDSSIDSLLERDAFSAFKEAIGLAPSPLFAPRIDALGQLRSDDPAVPTPSGLGGDVFKDRGAVERADFVGPVAQLLGPQDNDSLGQDGDQAISVVQLQSGVVTEFRIRLKDIGDTADPFIGLGVDDSTVVGVVNTLRKAGAAITVFENNRLLTEGIDYVFSFDYLTDQIVLTPVAGIFRPNSIYRISINNRDRFVVTAPNGPQAVDGVALSATDPAGGRILLEFDTGYQILLPEDLKVTIPVAGGGAGGVLDGNLVTIEMPAVTSSLTADIDPVTTTTISVTDPNLFPDTGTVAINNEFIAYSRIGNQLLILTRGLNSSAVAAHPRGSVVTLVAPPIRFTFEFDDNNDLPGTSIRVPFRSVDSQIQIADRLASVIRTHAVGANLPLRDVTVVDGSVLLIPNNDAAGQALTGVLVGKNGPLTLPPRGLALSANSNFADGDSFIVSDGRNTVTLELDSDGTIAANSFAVDITGILTVQALAQRLVQAVNSIGLTASPAVVAGNTVFLGLSESGSASVVTGAGITVTAVSRPLQNGQQFELSFGSRRYDLNDATATTEQGFIAVPATQLYSTTAGYGWLLPTTSTSDPNSTDRLLQDGHFGVASTTPGSTAPVENTFRVNVDPARDYTVILRMHDTVARDEINVTANGLVVPEATNISFAANETRTIKFIAPRSTDGVLNLRFTAPAGEQFVVNSIEVLEVSKLVEFSTDGSVATGVIAIPFVPGETSESVALKIQQQLLVNADLQPLRLTPQAYGSMVALGGVVGDRVEFLGNVPLSFVLGVDGLPTNPSTQSGTSLVISGPLLLQVPTVGGIGIADGAEFTIVNNNISVTFEMSVDNVLNNPQNVPVPYGFGDSPDELRDSLITVIAGAGLGLTPVPRPNGVVELGNIPASAVTATPATEFTIRPGTVSDQEMITLTNAGVTRTFEFESSVAGGGITLGNIQVPFDPAGTANNVATSLAAAINASDLGLFAEAINNEIKLVDSPQTRIDVSRARSVQVNGVPGGAIPVFVVNSPLFTAEEVKAAIINAVNKAREEGRIELIASDRGADTFFLEGATSLGSELPSYFLRSVQDYAGNFIKPNQFDNSVGFSILLPDALFDFGDAPDPVGQVAGRYPTLLAYNGARHVVTELGPRLGQWIDAEPDGQPAVGARGDDSSIRVIAGNSNTGASVFGVANSVSGRIVTAVVPAIPANAEGATLLVELGGRTLIFEVDSDGQFDEDHIPVEFDRTLGTSAQLAATLQQVLSASSLGLAAVTQTGAIVTIVADDEDGVVLGGAGNPSTVLTPGSSIRATIETRGPGLLSVWMDYNYDGDWDDPGERVLNNVAVPAGVSTQEIVLALPAGVATPADPNGTLAYARFRISTAGSLEPTGVALDGEVEDYGVRIVAKGTGFVANPDSFSATEDTTLAVSSLRNVLTNDVNRPGGQIVVYSADTGTRTLTGGVLTLNSNGTFNYQPNAEFFGIDTFTYRLVDQTLLAATGDLLVSDPVTVTINVAAVNDTPRRRDDLSGTGSPYPVQFTALEDQVVTFTAAQVLAGFNGNPSDDILPGPVGVAAPFDESNQTLRLTVIGGSATSNGGTALILPNGSLSYTPPRNYEGPDSFRLRVQDDGVPQRSVELNVSVFVLAANDPPLIVNHSYNTNEDVGLNAPVANGLLKGASDPDAPNAPIGTVGGLRVTSVDLTNTRGSVIFQADGSFSYTPQLDFNGTDQFLYTVTDAGNATSTGTVTITVAPVADAPRASSQPLLNLNLIEDGLSGFRDVAPSFFDPDGDPLTFSVTNVQPAGRVTTKFTSSLLEVTPLPDQFGQVLITVTASDGNPATADFSQVLTVSIAGSNDAPTINGAGLIDRTVNEGAIIPVIDLNQIFTDADGDGLQYRLLTNTDSTLVLAVINGGNLSLVLTPGASGSSVIAVEATDGTRTVTDQFNLSVTSVPDAPTSATDSYTVARGGILDAKVALNQSRTVLGGSGTTELTVNDITNLFVGMTVNGTTNSIKAIDVLRSRVTLVSPFSGATIDFNGGLLANDSDLDRDQFSVVAVRINGQERPLTSAPFNLGTGVLEFVASTGVFRYVENGGAQNSTTSFQYVLEDSTGRRSTGTANIRVGEPIRTHFNQARPVGDPLRGLDVNADSFISPIDALSVINLLNLNSGVVSIPVRNLEAPPPFVDVNGDGFVTPQDALAVINYLNSVVLGANGEAESATGYPLNAVFSSTSFGNNLPPTAVIVGRNVGGTPLEEEKDEQEDPHLVALESAFDWLPAESTDLVVFSDSEELRKEDSLLALDEVFDSLSLD